MHTNATVTLSNNGATATLNLGGEQLIATLRSPSGAAFTTQTPAARLDSDPSTTMYDGESVTASADQPNPGVTVLMIDVAAGDQTIEVLFNVRCCARARFSASFLRALSTLTHIAARNSRNGPAGPSRVMSHRRASRSTRGRLPRTSDQFALSTKGHSCSSLSSQSLSYRILLTTTLSIQTIFSH